MPPISESKIDIGGCGKTLQLLILRRFSGLGVSGRGRLFHGSGKSKGVIFIGIRIKSFIMMQADCWNSQPSSLGDVMSIRQMQTFFSHHLSQYHSCEHWALAQGLS